MIFIGRNILCSVGNNNNIFWRIFDFKEIPIYPWNLDLYRSTLKPNYQGIHTFMLRNIIIIGSSSGLVLFSKAFSNGISQPRLVGSLITAIIEFGQQTTGMGVCYIELTNVAITMVANDDAKVVCALFYDRDDGVLFGRLICSEILNAFTQKYSYDVTQFGKNLKDFYGFQKKIPNIIRFAPKSVIAKLETHNSVKTALFMNDREIIHTPNDNLDQLSILANLTAFTELCNGISKCECCSFRVLIAH